MSNLTLKIRTKTSPKNLTPTIGINFPLLHYQVHYANGNIARTACKLSKCLSFMFLWYVLRNKL